MAKKSSRRRRRGHCRGKLIGGGSTLEQCYGEAKFPEFIRKFCFTQALPFHPPYSHPSEASKGCGDWWKENFKFLLM